MPLQVNLEYGPFFTYGEMYHVSFGYSSDEQKNKMIEFFQSILPTYGVNGSRVNDGKEAIMPYFVDENGRLIYPGSIYGGTSIPEDLLMDFIKRFIEIYNANVHVGNLIITGKIEDELLKNIIESISPKLDKEFSK